MALFIHIFQRVSAYDMGKHSKIGSAYLALFYTNPFKRESAYNVGKHSKMGSAYLALCIHIPFKESRPIMWGNTLK
jgi:hypothetical protein